MDPLFESEDFTSEQCAIEFLDLAQYDATRRPNGEYEMKVPYDTNAELDEAANDLLTDIACGAETATVSQRAARMEGTDRHW